MPVDPKGGYSPGPDATPTGRTAQLKDPSGREIPLFGRETPPGRPLSFARLMGIEILHASNADIGLAKQDLIDRWDAWRKDQANEHFRVLELVFEHYSTATEEALLLYITYSE